MTAIPRIQDYAIIGSGRSAALVSREGSIDWLCWPRFDSPSIFGALLDRRHGGSWRIASLAAARIHRRYIDETNVLQTRFQTESGTLLLTDFMPAASEEQKGKMLWPEQELIRRVVCEQGEVAFEVSFDPRPDYGRAPETILDAGHLGWRIQRGSSLITLQSDLPLQPSAPGGAAGAAQLKAGQAAAFSLTYAADGPAVLAPLGRAVDEKLALTVAWWRDWARRARYEGPHRDLVVRSALVLKLMSYAPSGALVAAPTTSLPERVGRDSNWDYRYCWLRDAAFTTRALFGLGYKEDAQAFVSWMLHATRLTRPELRVAYDVYGETIPRESELTHLDGYANSRPVRTGNALHHQLQLDVYGEAIEAVSHFLRQGGELDRETRTMLRHFGEYVCRHWREPDNGIWEPRDRREHFTHSKLLCWVALDRLLQMHRQGRLDAIPAEKFVENRNQIRREIEEQAWNAQLACYAQTLGGATLDATVLRMAFCDFAKPDSPRMQQTFRRIVERLGAGPGLLYRYEQSCEAGEGAFVMCSFWLADFLARGGGSLQEAQRVFSQTLAHANELGLFAEEVDPRTGDALGNFPQAFSHVGLINAALSIAERERSERAQIGRRASPGKSPVGAAAKEGDHRLHGARGASSAPARPQSREAPS